MFARKNAEYANPDTWYANFLNAASVRMRVLGPLEYCLALCDKQDTAIWEHVRREDLTSSMFIERLTDKAVYSIIALALIKEYQGSEKGLGK